LVCPFELDNVGSEPELIVEVEFEMVDGSAETGSGKLAVAKFVQTSAFVSKASKPSRSCPLASTPPYINMVLPRAKTEW